LNNDPDKLTRLENNKLVSQVLLKHSIYFYSLYPSNLQQVTQTPHLHCFATGLSIGAAGLFGDDMVVAKMNFVVGLMMSQNWDCPSDLTAS
jgi:hypothetical protein